MVEKEILEKVLNFATLAHGDQERKYIPEPYIAHPVRVMEKCREHSSDICMLSAALLHDVLEDTPVGKDELLKFLNSLMNEEDAARTFQLVIELTDVYIKEDYPRFNRQKRKEMEKNRLTSISADSQTIKYADTIDNCSEIIEKDPDFARVFLNECKTMLQTIPHGNPQLYQEAKNLVERSIEKCKRKSGV